MFDTVVLSPLSREPGSQLTAIRLNYLWGQKPRNDTQHGYAPVREAYVKGCAHYGWMSIVHAPSGGSEAEHDLFFDSLMTALFEVFTARYTQQHLNLITSCHGRGFWILVKKRSKVLPRLI